MKIGCCGFPVARERYFRELDAVEITDSFYKLPRLATVQRWRAEAPAGFAFFLKAWQLVTHPADSPTYERLGRALGERERSRVGHFKPTDEVREAWESTAALARALGARAVLFQTPASFYPNATLLRDFYAFFKSLKRGEFALAWEPHGPREDALLRKVCRDLDLVHAVDPLRRAPAAGLWRYYRLHGLPQGRRMDYSHAFTDAELEKVAEAAGSTQAYVFFNNKSMWIDARRFKERPGARALRRTGRL